MSDPTPPRSNPDPGPENGDFVGYLQKLEQRQAERLHLPAEVSPAPGEQQPSPTSPGNPFSAANRAQVKARFEAAKQKVGPLGVLQLVQALIGAGLLIASLSEEGNFMMLVIGIALMWAPLTRLQRLLYELNPRKAPKPPSLPDFFGKRK